MKCQTCKVCNRPVGKAKGDRRHSKCREGHVSLISKRWVLGEGNEKLPLVKTTRSRRRT